MAQIKIAGKPAIAGCTLDVSADGDTRTIELTRDSDSFLLGRVIASKEEVAASIATAKDSGQWSEFGITGSLWDAIGAAAT